MAKMRINNETYVEVEDSCSTTEFIARAEQAERERKSHPNYKRRRELIMQFTQGELDYETWDKLMSEIPYS